MYDSLLFARRRDLHQRIGSYLLDHPDEWLGDHIAMLSHHFYHAQQWPEALHYTMLAADRARESYANEAAIDLYQRALDIVSHLEKPSDETLVHLWQSLGNVYTLVGRYDEALEQYQQAQERADNNKKKVELYEDQARALERKGELTTATEQVAAARVLLQTSVEDRLILARLEGRQAWLYHLTGADALALESASRAIHLLNHVDTT